MRTFGEFFDVVAPLAKADVVAGLMINLDEWVHRVSPDKWDETRRMELSETLFYGFADDIVAHFKELLKGSPGMLAHWDNMQRAHDFLRALVEKGKEFGINVDAERVDVALTSSDEMFQEYIRHGSGMAGQAAAHMELDRP